MREIDKNLLIAGHDQRRRELALRKKNDPSAVINAHTHRDHRDRMIDRFRRYGRVGCDQETSQTFEAVSNRDPVQRPVARNKNNDIPT